MWRNVSHFIIAVFLKLFSFWKFSHWIYKSDISMYRTLMIDLQFLSTETFSYAVAYIINLNFILPVSFANLRGWITKAILKDHWWLAVWETLENRPARRVDYFGFSHRPGTEGTVLKYKINNVWYIRENIRKHTKFAGIIIQILKNWITFPIFLWKQRMIQIKYSESCRFKLIFRIWHSQTGFPLVEIEIIWDILNLQENGKCFLIIKHLKINTLTMLDKLKLKWISWL